MIELAERRSIKKIPESVLVNLLGKVANAEMGNKPMPKPQPSQPQPIPFPGPSLPGKPRPR
jgi:hypothetical protein